MPVPVPAPAPRRGGVAFFLGGLAAVAIGFGLAQVLPNGWPRPPDETLRAELDGLTAQNDELQSTIGALNERLDAASEQIAALEARELPSFATPGDLDALGAQLGEAGAALAERLNQIEAAVDALEAVPASPDPTGLTEDDIAVFRNELSAVVASARAELDAARQAALAVEADAAKAAAREAAFEALTRLRTSVDLGLGYTDALADLTGAAPLIPAPALEGAADSGVVTMLELQTEFPDLARTAIAASATGPDQSAGAIERLGQFLRTQTNARSLTPREGTDADAVLSRAEAALMDNELPAALAELSTLPEGAADVFADWIAAAEIRVAAMAGLDDLAAQIGAM